MLRKSKKGYTLIELIVVVAIIGVLVLLGLRTYIPQKERANNSMAKANASTIQTMLVGYMGNHDILVVSAEADITAALDGVVAETGTPLESMVNPYSDSAGVYHILILLVLLILMLQQSAIKVRFLSYAKKIMIC